MKDSRKFATALPCAVILLCTLFSGCLHHSRLRPYAGQWVLRDSGKNIMVLHTSVHRGKLIGALTGPQYFTETVTEKGSCILSGVSLPIRTQPVVGRWTGNFIELTVGRKRDRDRVPMALLDSDHALLDRFLGQVPALKFERAASEPKITVATDWPEYNLDPEIVDLRQQLRTMAEEDKAARKKKLINPQETEQLSEQARLLLESIYAHYGWPRISAFGMQASDDFWLLVQHQPLALQERMLDALKEAVETGEALRRNYAYLFDRVQVSKGNPQHWGTQSKCEGKRAVLYPIDDAAHIEERRREIGLDSLADSIRGSDEVCAHVSD